MSILIIDDALLPPNQLAELIQNTCPGAALQIFHGTDELLTFLQNYTAVSLPTLEDSPVFNRHSHTLVYAASPSTADTRPKLRIKCFGNFDVSLPDGTQMHFPRSKSKEMLAYLVYRRGTPCTIREIGAALFEDRVYDRSQQTYLQKIASSLMQTLRSYQMAHIINKDYNSISVDISAVDCDYYRFLDLDPAALNGYTGEFLSQYPWSELMTGYLDRLVKHD